MSRLREIGTSNRPEAAADAAFFLAESGSANPSKCIEPFLMKLRRASMRFHEEGVNFAYSRVSVRVLLPNPERRRSYELMFIEADPLTRDLKSRFEENQGRVSDSFQGRC